MEPEDIMYTFDDLKQILEKLRDKENVPFNLVCIMSIIK